MKEQSKDDHILNCPFCGNKPEWVNLAHPSGIPALRCPECQFSMQQDRRDKTIFYWNRRQPVSTNSGLKALIKYFDDRDPGEKYTAQEIVNYATDLMEKEATPAVRDEGFEDFQDQVETHIKNHNVFDWHEALTDNEMDYLVDLLLTFNPKLPSAASSIKPSVSEGEDWVSVESTDLPLEKGIMVAHPYGIEAIQFHNAAWRYWYSSEPCDFKLLKSITHFKIPTPPKNLSPRE